MTCQDAQKLIDSHHEDQERAIAWANREYQGKSRRLVIGFLKNELQWLGLETQAAWQHLKRGVLSHGQEDFQLCEVTITPRRIFLAFGDLVVWYKEELNELTGLRYMYDCKLQKFGRDLSRLSDEDFGKYEELSDEKNGKVAETRRRLIHMMEALLKGNVPEFMRYVQAPIFYEAYELLDRLNIIYGDLTLSEKACDKFSRMLEAIDDALEALTKEGIL